MGEQHLNRFRSRHEKTWASVLAIARAFRERLLEQIARSRVQKRLGSTGA
jgi:hypothetical protein